jgi:hypothetical protein
MSNPFLQNQQNCYEKFTKAINGKINIILDFFLLYLMIGDTCTHPLPSSVYRKEFLEKLYTGDHL